MAKEYITKDEVEQYLDDYGFNRRLKGYRYFVDMIMSADRNPEMNCKQLCEYLVDTKYTHLSVSTIYRGCNYSIAVNPDCFETTWDVINGAISNKTADRRR